MSSNDYVKFLTEQIVGYITESKESKKQKKSTEPFLIRWFGLIPIALIHSFKKRKK